MKIARIGARLGAAVLTAITFGATIGVLAPPAGALTANHLVVEVLGIDGNTKLWISGQTFQVRVTAKDSSNNTDTLYGGTVSLVLSNGDTPPASHTFVPITEGGVHEFSVTLSTLAMGATIGATDGSLPSSMTPTSVNVAPKIVVSGVTTPIAVNGTSAVTVSAKNFDESQTISAYRGTVHFTQSGGVTNLPDDYAFVAGDTGTHTFASGATFPLAGAAVVTATDPATGSAGSKNVTVVPTLAVTGLTSPVATGTTNTVTVTAKNGDGSTYTGFTGTVHFTSSDAQANLPNDYTFVGGDSGTHTFTNGVTLNTPGARTVTATDAAASPATGTSSPVSVTPLLAVTGVSNPMTAGTVSDVVVTAKAYDNTHTLQNYAGYTGVVHFTTDDPSVSVQLPADFSFQLSDGGTHTFGSALRLITPGVRSVTATDTLQPLITGSQTGIAVNAGLLVSGVTDGIDLNAPSSFVVTAIDGAGAPQTGYTGTVHFTSSDSQAVLPADYTFLAGDNGSHTFTNAVRFRTAGDQSLTATDTVTSATSGSQGGITVVPKFSVTGIPVPSFRTVAGPVVVTAQNFNDSTATAYRGTVTFTNSDGAGTVPVNYTFTSGDSGVHTFSNAVTFNTTGTHTVSVKDTTPGTALSGSQTSITVVDPVVTSSTTSTDVAGTTHTVNATVNDGNGNNVPNGTLVHFVATRPGNADATGDVVTTNGAASWTFTSPLAGVSTVTVSAGTFSATPKTVTWSPAAIDSILLLADEEASMGETTVVIASAFDQFGNLVADGTPITFSVTGPGSAFPTPATDNTVGGVAIYEFFSDTFGTSTVHAVSGSVAAPTVDIDWVTGYWVFGQNGAVTAFGDAQSFGSKAGEKLNGAIIGAARTPSGQGYWLVGSDGGIFTFGDAQFFGSMGGRKLNAPVIGMSTTPTGLGYWLVAADGGIFTFGDALFYGSTGSTKLNQPVFAMAPTDSGHGYWLVARDGGIFTFGDALFYGSAGGIKLNKPIVGASTTLSGQGYWLVAGDGGIFTFGDAPFFGSAASQASSSPFVGMAPSPTGDGYWIVSKNGTVNSYGDAPNYGKAPDGAVAIVASH